MLHRLIRVFPKVVLRLLALLLVLIDIIFLILDLPEPVLEVRFELLVLGVPKNDLLDIALIHGDGVVNYRLYLIVILLHYIFVT